ncbi:MAG: 16S rRNA (uracil(1498)-N(3))-methyltransferase [Lachnospiraceae bacterium]|nr:16S rRNA (uracil(1498)-N(3))-methyltransferase [Lachnospiraceae bacterium]
MYHFYTDRGQISEKEITLTGSDVNHIKNVLRMREGEKLIICDGEGTDYHCAVKTLSESEVVCEILKSAGTESELETKIVLFQGLPKKDKMELIIQKAVELGVTEIVPVMTKRVIVKPGDEKKERSRIERYNEIARSAAKQSGRGIVPKVTQLMDLKKALEYASDCDLKLIPYENAEGMARARELVASAKGREKIAVFIGPEGGFEPSEVELAESFGCEAMTLGRRILRTETAGLALLAVLMFGLDE